MDFALFVQWLWEVSQALGYPGVFLSSLIGSATIILPLPSIAIVFAMGKVLNPWVVGVLAGLGSAIGELTGYLIGRGGREALKKKYKKWFKRAEGWTEKRGMFVVVFVFALTPLPDDVVGILAGVIKYDWRKFFLATLLGKIILSTAVALAGSYGLAFVLSFFGM